MSADEHLSRRIVEVARGVYEPFKAPLFPELAFIDDASDTFSITEWLESYEEMYGHPVGKYLKPQPSWRTWHELLLDLDEVLQAWLWPEPERPAFEQWCAGKGMLVQRPAKEEA